MASRKGVEPLTPGLGNQCSIQLSYRDNPCFRYLSGTRPRPAPDKRMIRLPFLPQGLRFRKPLLYPAELRDRARRCSTLFCGLHGPEKGLEPRLRLTFKPLDYCGRARLSFAIAARIGAKGPYLCCAALKPSA